MKHLLFALVCLIIIRPEPTTAQAGQNAQAVTRVPALVSITDDPAWTRRPFMVLRGAGGSPVDVILLSRSSANGATLSQAVYTLLAVRRTEGDTVRATRALGGETNAVGGQPVKQLPWAQRVADDVARAQPRFVPGIGWARTVQIWLPPQSRRP